jgi:signal transduction histidine kinase
MGIDRVKEKAGNGLRNMQERADKINADLKILKLPTAGTRVSLRFS